MTIESTDTILVTGGAGFIGSNFVLGWIENLPGRIINLDKLTYAGNLHNLDAIAGNSRHIFIRGDICNPDLVEELLESYHPRAVVNLAAESHVDRSIHQPDEFARANVQGTLNLLEKSRRYWRKLSPSRRSGFRFLQVSSDEVYGSLGPREQPFSETAAVAPNSPYAASKAAADHFVRAWHHTYGLPTLTTNCSNNYGPFQLPEKLIPLMILNALEGRPLPVYGDGENIRDWIYVLDHCEGIRAVLRNGLPGETYNIGGRNERKNIDLVAIICDYLDELRPDPSIGRRKRLIEFVTDRPGHDRRYAINSSKIENALGWKPRTPFEEGIRKTIAWYLANDQWVEKARGSGYREWLELNYGNR